MSKINVEDRGLFGLNNASMVVLTSHEGSSSMVFDENTT